MFNHARGLWGYTGTAADGEPLTIQATGIGAASAAVVLGELCALGLRTFVRVGTAIARDDTTFGLGDVVAVTDALPGDGVSRALGARDVVRPDGALSEALAVAVGRAAGVHSTDLEPTGPDAVDAPLADLQTAALLQLARVNEARAAAVLVVTGVVGVEADDHSWFDDEALLTAVTRAAHGAAAALGLPSRHGPPSSLPRDDEAVVA